MPDVTSLLVSVLFIRFKGILERRDTARETSAVLPTKVNEKQLCIFAPIAILNRIYIQAMPLSVPCKSNVSLIIDMYDIFFMFLIFSLKSFK